MVILPEQVSEELVFLEFEGPFSGIGRLITQSPKLASNPGMNHLN
jgi:hypothetical protein